MREVAKCLEETLKSGYGINAAVFYFGRHISVIIRSYEKDKVAKVLSSETFADRFLENLKSDGVKVDIDEYEKSGRICLDSWDIIKNSQLVI